MYNLFPALGLGLLLLSGCVDDNKMDGEATGASDSIAACAEAKTADACAAVSTPVTDRGEMCRWGEVQRAQLDGEQCTLVAVGGACIFATSDEGGPACSGLFRSVDDGDIELVQLDCGDPADDAWTLCLGQEASSPAHAACQCLEPKL